MIFCQQHSVLESCNQRHSTRRFLSGFTQLPKLKSEGLFAAVEEANSFPFLSSEVQLKVSPPGYGRFGSVSNESGWIIPLTSNSEANLEIGFRLQIVVIRLTQIGIATLFTGTIDQKRLKKENQGFYIPVAVAFGIPSSSFYDIILKFFSGSQFRKDIPDLFFDLKQRKRMSKEDADEFLPLFNAIRRSPSAMNYEPWFFLVDEKEIHVFIEEGILSKVESGIVVSVIVLCSAEFQHTSVVSKTEFPPPAFLGGNYACTVSFRD